MSYEAERQAAMEAQIASLDGQLHEIKQALLRMDTKLDAWQSTYVPRAEINEMFRSRDEKIEMLQYEIASKKALLPSWVHAAVATISVVLAIWSMTHHY